ncbi:unnamed protein product, partial [Symbiodinium pilosum]
AAIQHFSNFSRAQSAESTGDRREQRSRSFVGQPQDGTSEPFSDAMSDMGFSDTSTLCMG